MKPPGYSLREIVLFPKAEETKDVNTLKWACGKNRVPYSKKYVDTYHKHRQEYISMELEKQRLWDKASFGSEFEPTMKYLKHSRKVYNKRKVVFKNWKKASEDNHYYDFRDFDSFRSKVVGRKLR